MLLRPVLALLVWLSLALAARAHDPLTATIEVQVSASAVSCTVTFSPSVAAYLAGIGSAPRVRYAVENFDRDQVKFARIAADLCLLSDGGTPLPPLRSDVKLADQTDLAYTFIYTRPPSAARLGVEALWLRRLPEAEGYAAILTVRGAPDAPVTSKLLRTDAPAVDFPL